MFPKRVYHLAAGPGGAGLHQDHQPDAGGDPDQARIEGASSGPVDHAAVSKRQRNDGDLKNQGQPESSQRRRAQASIVHPGAAETARETKQARLETVRGSELDSDSGEVAERSTQAKRAAGLAQDPQSTRRLFCTRSRTTK